MVVDFRKLNKKTIGDRYLLPNIETLLQTFGGSNYYSVMDFSNGFYQVPLCRADQYKTAFSTPTGHYEFTHSPMGLKTSANSFQRLVNTVLKDCLGKICIVFMNDLLVGR